VCQVFPTEENTPLRCLSGHDDEVNAVCWSPGGELLASCSDDSTAKIWTVEDGLKYDLRGHLKEIFTLRWTPTGPNSQHPDKPLLLCTASFDGTVKVLRPLDVCACHKCCVAEVLENGPRTAVLQLPSCIVSVCSW
jgi:transducin (beta)-like 1